MNTSRQTATISKMQGITALYSRLSNEDDSIGQSNSVTNQQQILEDYAKKQGFSNIQHFFDDGTTGVRFDRDAWKELFAEVEAGNVSVVICKDMTRFGRNYLEMGMYLEKFKQYGVLLRLATE